MAGKKYLLLADLPKQEVRFKEVIVAFMKKAYLTDSVLFVMLDLNPDAFECFRWHFKNNVTWGAAAIQLLVKHQYAPEQIVSQMDYYVAFGSHDEMRYIEAAANNNVEIIGTNESPENIFSDIPVSREVIDFKEKLNELLAQDLFDKFPIHQYQYFLFHEGLGESISFFFWMKEYRESTDKKILMLCSQPLRREMMSICPYVDDVALVSPQIFDYISINFSGRYEIRNTYAMHSHPKIVETKRRMTEDEFNNYNTPEEIRDFLNLPSEFKFKTWSVSLPVESVTRAQEVFDEMHLTRGKTVFIVTEGNSFNRLHHHNDFWIRLSEKLRLNGYEIVFNGVEKNFNNFKSVYLSLFETSAFIGLCGNVVSVPTGLIEAAATFNTVDPIKWQVIFPNQQDPRYHTTLQLWFDAQYYQKFGTRDIDKKRLKKYRIFLREYLSANVNLWLFNWGNNLEEDAILIQQIVENIKAGD